MCLVVWINVVNLNMWYELRFSKWEDIGWVVIFVVEWYEVYCIVVNISVNVVFVFKLKFFKVVKWIFFVVFILCYVCYDIW